ncbi:MAG: hypothetical protein LRY51_16255 [Geovibrio sp.]|nr:hypothetical protein [Geovibrio sp.]
MSYVSFLKAQDTVIGIEKIDSMTFEKRPYVYANREITAILPVVAEGGAARRPNIELIVSLKPDVIFTITADASEAELLQRKTRTPVVVLSYGYSGVNFDDTIQIAPDSRQNSRQRQKSGRTHNIHGEPSGRAFLSSCGEKACVHRRSFIQRHTGNKQH